MNLFDIILLDFILLLFPLLFYEVFLFTNKNIKKKQKELLFVCTFMISFLSIYKFNSDNTILNFLLLVIPILLCFLKEHYKSANIMLIILYLSIDINILLFLPLILLNMHFLMKKRISDITCINIFLFLEYSLILSVYKINLEIIGISITIYFIMHIMYLLMIKSEEIIQYHMKYKELQNEKQIRLSLFKITHEIKNPIAVCKGYLDMLNVHNSEQVNKYIPIIKGEIERLLTLLEDFMLVNKDNVDLDIMDINMLLEEVIDKLKPMVEERDITLKSDLIDDEIYINGDYKRLSQVFINLVKNSIEAIPEDRKGIINIKDSIKDNHLNITIQDNGIGISNNIINKIKEPFYTTKLRGTGLGVSLSNEIISAHNGSLNYYSKEGVETKTIVEIPLFDDEYL
ncbi:MAG: HAMP domain-containing histidine kinase [Bacilli bacterium]|nr:HAMP domain-containing histidine kinase [Bacilli bacterium]